MNQGVPQGYEVTCSQGSVRVLRSAVSMPEAGNLCKPQAGGWLLPQTHPRVQHPLLPPASLPTTTDGPRGQGLKGGSPPAPRGLPRAPCWSESPESQRGDMRAQILPLSALPPRHAHLVALGRAWTLWFPPTAGLGGPCLVQSESPGPADKTRWGELDSPKNHVCAPPPTAQSPLEGGAGTCGGAKKLLKCEILRCAVSVLCQQRPIV